jgi:3-oxo-5alpha-steroid 4-dehydrogenase
MLDYQRFPGILSMLTKKSAPTIEVLARKIGLDPAALRASVEAYNRGGAGVDRDEFRKDQKEIHPLVDGPFYAIDISASNTVLPMMGMTLGGLTVSEETGQVLRPDGSGIAGLYAAGRAAIGICSNVYMSGLSVADCIFAGRRVGRQIVDRVASPTPEPPIASPARDPVIASPAAEPIIASAKPPKRPRAPRPAGSGPAQGDAATEAVVNTEH